VNIQVLRWPLLEVRANKVQVRTMRALAMLPRRAEIGARGIVHVSFPGMQGMYEFRLSTGLCTLDKMRDYVITADDLSALRKERDRMKAEAKS
jgi:hypothetical protein